MPARAEAALRGPVRLRGGMGQDRARRGSDPLPPTGQSQGVTLRMESGRNIQIQFSLKALCKIVNAIL